MLLRCIRAENRKLHASPIWFMFFILPIISAGYGTFNYLQNLEILRDGWVQSVDPAHTILLAVFLSLHGGGIRGVPVAGWST